MSDAPKFEVIDRRKMKAEQEERESAHAPAPEPAVAEQTAAAATPAEAAAQAGPQLVKEQSRAEEFPEEMPGDPALPPAPTAEESREQKTAYDASAQRLEELVRAQNPGTGPQPPVTFEHLVQQFYVSAMIQMGAGTQEGQRPRVDILGAKQTMDLLGVLAEKTKGNLTPAEDRMLQAVLFEGRMAFLELTNMITMPGVAAPTPPDAGKR